MIIKNVIILCSPVIIPRCFLREALSHFKWSVKSLEVASSVFCASEQETALETFTYHRGMLQSLYKTMSGYFLKKPHISTQIRISFSMEFTHRKHVCD